MNDKNQDPFAKYDKLFEEQDRKSAQDTARTDAKNKKSFKAIENRTNKTEPKTSIRPKNPVRIILTVIFVILAFQALPFIVFNSTGMTIMPIFSFIFFFVIINIIIKAFKR